MRTTTLKVTAWAGALGGALALHAGWAIGQEVEPPSTITSPADARAHGLGDLRDVRVPGPDLGEFLNPGQERGLAQLGKMLFWDTAVSSDGVSCATCHFHAGADRRTIGLSSPGLMTVRDERDGDVLGYHAAGAARDESFQTGGPGEPIGVADFPLVPFPGQVARDPNDAAVVRAADGNSNDAMSSPGVVVKTFDDVLPAVAIDECSPIPDGIFRTDDGTNTRRVPPRNTPSAINAVFNAFNFWDGRANYFFNGLNPFGKLDPSARVLYNDGTDIVERRIDLPESSLASQSVGPPLSDFEESCANGGNHPRTWQHVGKKLVRTNLAGNSSMTALSTQVIDRRDSLIGEFSRGNTAGANILYRDMIKRVFKSGWWESDERRILLADAGIVATERPAAQAPFIAYPDPVVDDAVGEELDDAGAVDDGAAPAGTERFTLMEMNFPLFFGLAIQAYEATLVADDSPFDRWMRSGGSVSGFGRAELAGLNVFVNEGKCANCHGGPEMTNASVANFQNGKNLIEPMVMGDDGFALYDNGFYNIGVTPTVEDIGRGGRGPNDVPLASSRQRLADELNLLDVNVPIIGGDHVLAVTEDPPPTAVCNDDGDGFCDRNEPINGDFQRAAVDGAFKTPGLRNVELTGPYFHNGGVISLAQLVEFYDNGGNFCRFNIPDLDPDITSLGLTSAQKRDLVRFLISLTDDRVRYERAPFDHPSLRIATGDAGGSTFLLRAVGQRGVRSTQRLRPVLVGNHNEIGDMPVDFACSPDVNGTNGN